MSFTTFDTLVSTGTLSNGNLTVAENGSYSGGLGRTADALRAGKYYFEMTWTTVGGGDQSMGVITQIRANGQTANNLPGASYNDHANDIGCFENGSVKLSGNNPTFSGAGSSASVSLGGTLVNGNVVGVAVDFTNGLIWFKNITQGGYWNGVSTSNPATGTGGLLLPVPGSTNLPTSGYIGPSWVPYASLVNSSTSFTANFGASTFSASAPSGFNAGWPANTNPAYVEYQQTQTTSTDSNGSPSTTTIPVSCNAGAILVLSATWVNGSANSGISAISGGSGLTWAQRGTTQTITGPTGVVTTRQIWWAYAATAQNNVTLTLTYGSLWNSGPNGQLGLVALSVQGAYSSSAPWDSNSALPVSAHDTSGSSTLPSVPGVSTTASSGLLLWFGSAPSSHVMDTPSYAAWGAAYVTANANSGQNLADHTVGFAGFNSTYANATISANSSGADVANWAVTVDAISASSPYPSGTFSTVESSDTLTAAGWSVSPGNIGYLSALESNDIFAASGAAAAVGTLSTTEAPDIFSAYGYEPVTGTWISTEKADSFSAVGFGVGISGSWSSTEASDTVEISGYSPVSGQWVSIEAADIFVATAAGVVVTRNQIMFFVT